MRTKEQDEQLVRLTSRMIHQITEEEVTHHPDRLDRHALTAARRWLKSVRAYALQRLGGDTEVCAEVNRAQVSGSVRPLECEPCKIVAPA